jgi:signal transduction histidine kinase
MRRDDRDAYQSWLIGEILLVGLLGAILALFVSRPELNGVYRLPQLRLVVDTAVALAATLVAVLAAARFKAEGRRLDLLLCLGFSITAWSTFAFAIAPVVGGHALQPPERWSGLISRLLGAGLIAAAPFARGRLNARQGAIQGVVGFSAVILVGVWIVAHSAANQLPTLGPDADGQQPYVLTAALAVAALLNLLAGLGFGSRFRTHRQDLDRWLALGATLALFADLHYVFTPLSSAETVSQGDLLRLVSYCVLLVGVWRAIAHAEFGRAVAEERARVAREIHDGLAQYLFAVSTHASMLESGAPLEQALPRLREAAAAAQQEAKFAVLALSSASGNAPFDAALRRYVEFLTADGKLEVELEIDDGVRLAPDEQIELFRIVQESLANARKHANARRAEVHIGEQAGRRYVVVSDDGSGFDEAEARPGQGLKNIRERAATIGGGMTLRSRPGAGTALEVLLRT